MRQVLNDFTFTFLETKDSLTEFFTSMHAELLTAKTFFFDYLNSNNLQQSLRKLHKIKSSINKTSLAIK